MTVFDVLPTMREKTTAYNSSVQAPMSRDDLRCYLVENGLLDGA